MLLRFSVQKQDLDHHIDIKRKRPQRYDTKWAVKNCTRKYLEK